MTKHRTNNERKQQIRNAALRCFSRSGYVATRIDDIAARAKLSKGAIYWHYPSKRAIFVDLVEEWFGRSIEQIQGIMKYEGPIDRVLLIQAANVVGLDLVKRRKQLPILLEFWSQIARDRELRDLYNRIYGAMRLFFSRIVSEHADSVNDGNPDAIIIVGAYSGILIQWLANEDIDFERVHQRLIELIDLLYQARSTSIP